MYVGGIGYKEHYKLCLQVCESQEQCRNAIIDLLDELDIFLSISEEIRRSQALEERKLSKQATVTMLLLIKNMSTYVCEASERNLFGIAPLASCAVV